MSNEQLFIVATNNYRANGGVFPGTGSDHVVIHSPDASRSVLANYIRANSPVTPTADGNWSFAPTASAADVMVVFRIPNTYRAHRSTAEQLPSATFLDVNANNEAVYRLDLH